METNKPKASASLFLLMMLSISSCSAFNITKILENEDDFSTFNQHLSETKLADQINKRSTITVLAVDNSAMGGLGDDSSVTKAIMSVHVILDYYDKEKLTKLAKNNKSATLTTLYQTSGLAKNQQGFVRISTDDDGITFGSASKDSEMNSKLVKSVAAQPYNISVLQVSSIIGVPDINANPSPQTAPPPRKHGKEKSPSSSSDDAADGPSDDTAGSPDDSTADSPDDSDSDEEKAPSPAKHNTPPKPKEVDSDSPSTSPAPAPGKSDARATAAEMGVGFVAMGLVSILMAFF
ncbi:fasciclin-like arabinogalactan protein 14 [Argentina anserina]|uniref:fasciclin-like arabinogalactan protein 14 n=1 Tax=Argentina anserina TaxID=57926 RepID=UPI0021767CD7|nr:fasciclin-like arabinogalactan protein 14 [Potentilla anserina]